MTTMLFVCKGNINRSVTAELLLRQLLIKEGLDDVIKVDSAGTSSKHAGEPPYPGTRKILRQHGISFEGVRARQVTAEDMNSFDYVIAMDRANLRKVIELFGRKDVQLFSAFIPNAAHRDVPDPSITGEYEYVYQMIETGCRSIVAFLKEKKGLIP